MSIANKKTDNCALPVFLIAEKGGKISLRSP